MPFEIDPKAFVASLGGTAAVKSMSHEARADALEDYSIRKLDEVVQAQVSGQNTGTAETLPTAAEIDAQIDIRTYRRGAGNLFSGGKNVERLEPMPPEPTLFDFFKLRFQP